MPLRRTRLVRTLAALAVAATAYSGLAAPAEARTTVTPRHFTGYGFDQCEAPSQAAMDAWLTSSPYWAAGIYISGKSRGCRAQTNLTPTWVETQLANGWRLLPITLGPQASCNPSFPRYSDDVRINPVSSNRYEAARRQGRAEAKSAVAAAKALGIGAGSTLWYDLEAFDISNTACRESALWFTSAWTWQLHRLDYVSGFYSSAGSGIKALDDARVDRPGTFTLPDRIWIARWDEKANTSTDYIRPDGWLPGNRMKQYRGGHHETWGGVTINIDNNWLDLGRGSVPRRTPEHCGGVDLDLAHYPTLGVHASGSAVTAAQCLLVEQGFYTGPLDGQMSEETRAAVRAARTARGLGSQSAVGPRTWTSLLSWGSDRLIKYGAAGESTRRLQRALNAAVDAGLEVTGTFEGRTTTAVKDYRRGIQGGDNPVVTSWLWSQLHAGKI